MNRLFKEYSLGKIILRYFLNPENQMGMILLPADKRACAADKKYKIEPLVQAYLCGDGICTGFANGHTMTGSETTERFQFVSQKTTDTEIITLLRDDRNREIEHIVTYSDAWEAITVKSRFINGGNHRVRLEMLSSVNLGGLTPYEENVGCLKRHCIKSAWSAEGRVVSESLEDLHLEPSWSGHGVRCDRIGQAGSMPVRGYYPFTAIEDTHNKVTWAVALSCNSSWQIELRRRDGGLSLNAGLADYNYGHWAKELAPGGSFMSPEAFVTVVSGGADEASQCLLTVQKTRNQQQLTDLPVIFNEYCTTWGVPSEENLQKIIHTLQGKNIDCLVIDSGWYTDGKHAWYEMNGDWEVNEDILFPHGLQATVKLIHNSGMKAGIWFEFETCGEYAKVTGNRQWLLKRNGFDINVGGKHFLDMRSPEVIRYLEDKVIGFLKKYGFDYVKVDYNDSIGIGCDGAESLGEGLRENMDGSKRFFKEMIDQIPGLIIENCASGGHRAEPSMMEVSAMASFSDAHECNEIPIIAANMHRMILPAQSQVWAVLRKGDSIKRITYSLAASFLGVMCLSGDIYDLSRDQWRQIEKGITFYRGCSSLIRSGKSQFFGSKITSYRQPEGWQAVVRTSGDTRRALLIAHCFAAQAPLRVGVPLHGVKAIVQIFSDPSTRAEIAEGGVEIVFAEGFSAVAMIIEQD